MKVVDIFKSEKTIFFMAFIILIVMGYGGKFIYSSSILQKGVFVEAVICSVRSVVLEQEEKVCCFMIINIL